MILSQRYTNTAFNKFCDNFGSILWLQDDETLEALIDQGGYDSDQDAETLQDEECLAILRELKREVSKYIKIILYFYVYVLKFSGTGKLQLYFRT